MTTARNQSTSLRRGIDVLLTVALACERGSESNLTEIAAQSGINRSTVSRLLQPMVEARLIDQDAETGSYRLGPQTARLGQIYLENFDVHDVAGPILQRLVEQTNETAHLGVLDGTDVVYVDKHESPLSVRTVARVGSRQPLYSTSMGKVLHAHSSHAVFDAAVQAGLPRRTDTTITEAEALALDLERVRSCGYAIDDEENELEIRCVGSPVFEHRGKVVAAISLSGPSTRMSTERVNALSKAVIAAAAEMSAQLGAPEETERPHQDDGRS